MRRAKQEKAGDARQKACFGNAAEAAEAALDAVNNGNEDQAKKMKKKALRWVVQAVRECATPGQEVEDLQGALKEEGAMSQNAIDRFNDLMEDLVEAKKRKKTSGNPFFDGLAINQIMLALDKLITDGYDGCLPNRVQLMHGGVPQPLFHKWQNMLLVRTHNTKGMQVLFSLGHGFEFDHR